MVILRKLKGNYKIKMYNLLISFKKGKICFFLPLISFNAFLNLITLFFNKDFYFYFYEVKMYGLGFKISVSKERVLRLDLGWSHALVVTLPKGIFLLRKKSEFLFYSKNFFLLSNFVFCLKKYYKRSPYYVKGIFDIHEKIIKKLGKQRQK